MKMLAAIHTALRYAYYSWAHHEINPMHDDVLKVALRRIELRDKLHRLLGDLT